MKICPESRELRPLLFFDATGPFVGFRVTILSLTALIYSSALSLAMTDDLATLSDSLSGVVKGVIEPRLDQKCKIGSCINVT